MTSAADDLYAILGLPRDAGQEEISAAFRSLLRHYHPDTRAPGTSSQDAVSDAALQQALTAYQTLRDSARRSAYDQQTDPRPTSSGARPIRVSVAHPAEDPPLRAGPVHWTPAR